MTATMSPEWQQGNWASHKITIILNSQLYRDLGDLSNLKTGNKTVIFISRRLKLERYTRDERAPGGTCSLRYKIFGQPWLIVQTHRRRQWDKRWAFRELFTPAQQWISPLPVTAPRIAWLHYCIYWRLERTWRTRTFINKERTMQFVSIESFFSNRLKYKGKVQYSGLGSRWLLRKAIRVTERI